MPNDELPEGWCWCCAEQLRTQKRYSLAIGPFGSNLKVSDYRDEGVPLVFVREIRAKDFGGLKTKFVTPEKAAELRAHSVSGGDLLITKMGDPPGDVAIYPKNAEDAIITADCIKLSVDGDRALTQFVAYAIECPQTKFRLEEITAGVAQQKISLERFRDFPLPLAPYQEQKRIADKLDALLGRMDACRARLDRVPALLKRFRQSVLSAATSGRLTAEWRMTNGVNDTWEETQLQNVADQVFDGPFGSHLKTADYTASGVRVARLENIGWMAFHAEKEAFISPAKYKTLTRHTLKKDDLVFSSFISEETRVALLPDSWSGKAINKSDCYCVRIDQGLCLPKFLMLRLACRSTYHILGEDVHGATRPRINLGQLKGFSFALPPLPEQKEIVRRVEALFAFADRIEARLATAQMTVERLTPATLAKAFRGELVPQDPNDEPASALLERLQSQPAAKLTRATRKPRK